MATVKSYDQRCYDLAAIFLGDEPTIHNEANIHAMALEIQQTIEDEIYYMLNPDCPRCCGKTAEVTPDRRMTLKQAAEEPK